MHEWTIAEGIVSTVLKYAENHEAKKIVKVNLKVGELSQLDVEILKDAIKMLSQGTIMEEAEIVFKIEKASFKCLNCNYTWDFDSVRKKLLEMFCGENVEECDNPVHYVPDLINAFIKCPKCGSPDFEIASGKGVQVASIDIIR